MYQNKIRFPRKNKMSLVYLKQVASYISYIQGTFFGYNFWRNCLEIKHLDAI